MLNLTTPHANAIQAAMFREIYAYCKEMGMVLREDETVKDGIKRFITPNIHIKLEDEYKPTD